MSETATESPAADEKKEKAFEPQKKDSSNKESFDELVAVRAWTGSKFINPVDKVPAYRKLIGDKPAFVIVTTRSDAPPRSEITDADGNAYVVEKVTKGSTFHICYVAKKK